MSFLSKTVNKYILKKEYPENFFKYIGTAGSRFSMMKQIRSTGGIWFSYGGITGVIDPGPGSLFNICRAVPDLDPNSLDIILLSHKHLDHSTDINVLVEAMTNGGFEKKGIFILPMDCYDNDDPVLLRYSRRSINLIVTPEDKDIIELGKGVTVEIVTLEHHGVQCFGFIFRKEGLKTWGVISDTKPLEKLSERYAECDFISVNATFPQKKPNLDHMSFEDIGDLIKKISPRLVTVTHLGLRALENNPPQLARKICTPETKVYAGEDGMFVNLSNLDVFRPRRVKLEVSGYSKG